MLAKCSIEKGRSIVDQRLKRRALLGVVLATAGLAAYVTAVQMQSATFRVAAVLLVPPVIYLIMACVSPAETSDDLSPVLELSMFSCCIVSSMAAFGMWAYQMPTHPCGYLVAFPSLFGCLTRAAVPMLGLYNSMWYWPAERFIMFTMGGLRFAQVVAQTHALLLAEVAAIVGLSELLPVPVAAQCQAHHLFLPVGVSQSAALVFASITLLTGFVLTPSMRTRLATLSGRLGLPAARVLHLDDGISLADEPELNAAPPRRPINSAHATADFVHQGRRSHRVVELCRSRNRPQLDPQLPVHQMEQSVRGASLLGQTHSPCVGTTTSCGSEGTCSELGGALFPCSGEAAMTWSEESDVRRIAAGRVARPHHPVAASSIGSSMGTAATEANVHLLCIQDVAQRYSLPAVPGAVTVYAPITQFGGAEQMERMDAVLGEADRAKLLVSVGCDGRLVYASTGEPIAPSLPPYASPYTLMFVALASEAIYICADSRVKFHHELAGNAPVVAAGEMVLSDGSLLSISNRSGHYRPPPECLRVVVSLLRARGAKTIVPFKEFHYDAAGNQNTIHGSACGRRGCNDD